MSCSSKTIELMGMGNPLLDISITVNSTDILDKYGLQLNNAILAEEQHLPLYKEMTNEYEVDYIAGGATQNSIRVAQWMLTQNNIKPNATAFMGCVGKDDAYGKQLEECASNDGVLVHYMKDESGAATGTCAVIVKDGERSLVANLAAANNFQKSHLETDMSKSIYESANYFYMAGFFLTVSVESMEFIGEHAVANNKTFALNLSAPFIVDFFGDQVAKALEYADYLFANESEAAAYAKKNGMDDSDLKQVALKVAELPLKNSKKKRTVVFTQGSESTIVASDGKVVEFAVDPLSKDKLVDTNGAGDAFVGGFLSQLVLGRDLEAQVHAGHWAARTIIQRSGCSVPQTCDYPGLN